MAKELRDYQTGELYKELCTREDVFSVQLWVREDVEECFPDKTDEEIDRYMDNNHKYFGDRCTQLGWEVMGDLDY